MMQRLKNRDNTKSMRRVNYIEESEEEESEEDEEQLLLRTDGNGCEPFYMKGTMCGNYIEAIIDTCSPVSIFTKRDLLKIVGERQVVIRDMIECERYVDYNKKPLSPEGKQNPEVQHLAREFPKLFKRKGCVKIRNRN